MGAASAVMLMRPPFRGDSLQTSLLLKAHEEKLEAWNLIHFLHLEAFLMQHRLAKKIISHPLVLSKVYSEDAQCCISRNNLAVPATLETCCMYVNNHRYVQVSLH